MCRKAVLSRVRWSVLTPDPGKFPGSVPAKTRVSYPGAGSVAEWFLYDEPGCLVKTNGQPEVPTRPLVRGPLFIS